MTNQKNQEIIKIQEQTDTDYLQRYLRQCESEILSLAYDENDKDMFVISNCDRILVQAKIRCALLNRMFELNYSESHFQDLEMTNQRLVEMEAKVSEIHKQRYQRLTCIHPDYKLNTILIYHHDAQNPRLITMEDDGFYGSQWNEMLNILDMIHGMDMTDDLYGCDGDYFDSYHNGLPYKEPCEIDIALPQEISFCYSFSELCNRQHYSVPDIMRMTSYHIRQEVFLDEPLDWVGTLK